ncbi:MAG: hypothetical protein PSX80_14000 [bacterium]|nr:hypothetical protein [bacterium]
MVIGIRFLIVLSLLIAAGSTYAQSSDQMFPTPIRTSEIASSIKARAIGDPRVTTYYYTFEGQQGDVFINVQSKNFSGDVDVYVVPSQQPLTKIVIYGDQPEAETGRVIYLRKPERLLLRIQGRSPGDDDASLRIKFAGSFSASTLNEGDTPAVPKVESSVDSNVRVNSVGTILEVIPKATPSPDSARLSETPEPHDPRGSVAEEKVDKREAPKVEADQATPAQVVVTDPVVEGKKEDPPKSAVTPRNRNRRRASTTTAKVVPPAETRDEKKEDAEQPTDENLPSMTTKDKAPKVDPMAGINLVIYFKDGSRIDRPMTEVQRFSVERAVLTVISKNGTIGRYNMTEVSRVSIE